MRWADFRGIVAVAAIVAAIVLSWRAIEARPIASTVAEPTSTTTTTTVAPTTTTTPVAALADTCDRAAEFVAEASLVPTDADPGPLARLALSFWSDLEPIAPDELRQELTAVINYYEAYLETGGPFAFDPVEIILEGDKERFEQLVTRPAPGLQTARDTVAVLCGIEVPDQPSISARSFEDLEDRLLDPEDTEEG